MQKKHSEKLVLASAAAGAFFTAMLLFRVGRGLIILGQTVSKRRQQTSSSAKPRRSRVS